MSGERRSFPCDPTEHWTRGKERAASVVVVWGLFHVSTLRPPTHPKPTHITANHEGTLHPSVLAVSLVAIFTLAVLAIGQTRGQDSDEETVNARSPSSLDPCSPIAADTPAMLVTIMTAADIERTGRDIESHPLALRLDLRE